MNLVVSQPFYFPWVGMLEQLRLADCYVNYDDVQFSKGSFQNRVQVKTAQGARWMTIPLESVRLGQPICEVRVASRQNWQREHLALLARAYEAAPFRAEMLELVEQVLCGHDGTLGSITHASFVALARYFELDRAKTFLEIRRMDIAGANTSRVRDIAQAVGADVYVTGHGARHYLDHDDFERCGIEVRYMDYRRAPYPQLHGAFTPFVSALDLVANCGKAGAHVICSTTKHWKEFLQ